MNKLIEFSLKNPLLIVVFTICLIGGGFYAAKELPIDAFPDVSSTQVKIIMKSSGLTPEEIETWITAPIEVEMLGLPHQAMLRSVAKYGLQTSRLILKTVQIFIGHAIKLPSV